MSLATAGTTAPWRRLGRDRDVALLLVAALVSQTGDWMLGTGVAFALYSLTGSTLASATALLVTQAPQVALGSVAGVLVDRWPRPRVLVVVNVLLAVVLLPLTTLQRGDDAWVVYLVLGLSSCLAPLLFAAEASLLPALVRGPRELVTVNAANAQVRNLARLLGAALGGVLIASGGLVALALADVASFGVAALLIAAMRRRPDGTATRARPARPRLAHDWREGLRVIRGSRELAVVIGFCAAAGLGEAAMGTLLAPFVHDVLGGDGRTFGALLAVQAVGGVAGGALVTLTGHRRSPRALFGWGAVAFGALDLVLFLYPLGVAATWPAFVVIVLVGFPAAAFGAGMLTVFGLATTDATRGRVFGTVTTAQNATMLVGTLLAGALAGPIGVIPVIAVQGVVHVGAGLAVLAALR